MQRHDENDTEGGGRGGGTIWEGNESETIGVLLDKHLTFRLELGAPHPSVQFNILPGSSSILSLPLSFFNPPVNGLDFQGSWKNNILHRQSLPGCVSVGVPPVPTTVLPLPHGLHPHLAAGARRALAPGLLERWLTPRKGGHQGRAGGLLLGGMSCLWWTSNGEGGGCRPKSLRQPSQV